jgi:hypothetical protein
MTTTNDHPVLYAVFGLNRAGRILYTTLFCLSVPAVAVWFVLLPRLRFHQQDEDLFRAARHGDVRGIEQALASGGSANAAAPIDGKTALFRAAVFGHADAVRTLLARGADPEKRGNDGHSVLEVVQAARAEERDLARQQALDAVAAVLRDVESKR